MITKQECYDRREQCNTRYKSMLDSGNKYDAANAEVYRLASQQWGEIAAGMPGVERDESASRMLQSREIYDPQVHIDQIAERWRYYVTNGVRHDSIDNMVFNAHQQFLKDDRTRRRMQELIAAGKATDQAGAKILADEEWDKGTAKWVKDAKAALLPRGGEMADDDPRRFLDPNAINGILNEFRYVLGLPVPG